MSLRGGSGDVDPTRVDREPPAFPQVGDPRTGAHGVPSSQPLFSQPDRADLPAQETAVSTEPVTRPRGQGRIRWAVAGLATLLVVAVVGGVLLLSGPRAGAPSVVEYYVPADTAGYVELRLDFPGDQRDQLAAFMSRFPGFADPAAFQRKVDESLDSILRSTSADVDWTNDVAPWFGGQVAMFGQPMTQSVGTPPAIVVALTVKDRARLDALIDERLANVQVEAREHQGQTVRTLTHGPSGERISFVVTDEVVLVGTRVEDIQAALDVKAGSKPALAQDAFYLQQLGSLHADRLGTSYYDGARVAEVSPAVPDVLGMGCMDAFQASALTRSVGEARAEGDHIAMTARSQAPTGTNVPPLPENRASVLTAAMPASTIAYFEARQVGASVRAAASQFLDCLETSAEAPFEPRALEQFLGTEPESYLDFIGDLGVALTFEDGVPGGGLIATVDDEAVARQRLERLLATVRAFASFGGEGITVEDVEHNGVTMTVFSFRSLAPGIPDASLSVTVANGRLYMGVNDFVTDALDRESADSLAGNAALQTALAAGGTDNAGLMYVDIVRVRELVETAMSADDRARYEAEVKPFIQPLTSAAVVHRSDNGMLVTNVFLYVE